MRPTVLFRYPRLLVLGAVQCLLLGFLTHLLLQRPLLPALPKGAPTLVPEMRAPSSVTDSTNAEELYAALTSKPVFHTSRQLVPEHPAPDTPETPPPAYVLTGYLGLPGRAPHAYLQPSSGGRTLIVGLGDSVDGWTVVGVNPRQVNIKQGDRSISIGKDGNSASQSAGPATLPVAGAANTSASNADGNQSMSTTPGVITVGNGGSAASSPASPPKLMKQPVAHSPENSPRLFALPPPAASQKP